MSDLSQARADVELLTAALLEEIERVWGRLDKAEQELLRDYLSLSATSRKRRGRELLGLAHSLMTEVRLGARGEVDGMLQGAFEGGVQRTAVTVGQTETVVAADSTVLRAAQRDTYADVLRATRHVEQTTKELVRVLARQAADLRIGGSVTAEDAAKALARRLDGYGISAIVYRDGSRHGLADYTNMLLRTKTAEVYQLGGFEQAREFGIRWMEILDNPSCGLTKHDDPQLANGMIVTLAEAQRYPISHPRCVRVTVARPDLTTAAEAAAAGKSTTRGQDADQRGVEQTRQAAAARRAERRQLRDRAARDRAGLLTPSAGAAGSPAARRAAARVARRTTGGTP